MYYFCLYHKQGVLRYHGRTRRNIKEFGRIPWNKKKNGEQNSNHFGQTMGRELSSVWRACETRCYNLLYMTKISLMEISTRVCLKAKKQYERLKIPKHRDRIRLYYERLKETNSSGATYAALKESEVFYKWEHFRFRSSFETGWPMGWMDWNGYFDANGVTNYFSDQYKSDGIFKEVRYLHRWITSSRRTNGRWYGKYADQTDKNDRWNLQTTLSKKCRKNQTRNQ